MERNNARASHSRGRFLYCDVLLDCGELDIGPDPESNGHLLQVRGPHVADLVLRD